MDFLSSDLVNVTFVNSFDFPCVFWTVVVVVVETVSSEIEDLAPIEILPMVDAEDSSSGV